MRQSLRGVAMAVLMAGLGDDRASASGGGYTGGSCGGCHSGGAAVTLSLTGPTSLAPGATGTYQLAITSTSTSGGLDVKATAGTFGLGGSQSALTQLSGSDVTHTAAKAEDAVSHNVLFSFTWTAPLAFTSATLTAHGAGVNGNGGPSGDAASSTTLIVSVAATPTATATASSTRTATGTATATATVTQTPTVTATPTVNTPTATPTVNFCADHSGLHPALLADSDVRACQETIAKAGRVYAKKDLKAVQKCLKAYQAGQLGHGDPTLLCVGNPLLPPSDATAAATIADAADKARALIAASCDDSEVAALDLCAVTESTLETCLITQHRLRVVQAVSSQYGGAAEIADTGTRKCQQAIGKSAAKLFAAHVKASQKCLNTRNRDGAPADGAVHCAGALTSGAFVAPADATAADKIAKAATKLSDKLALKCSDTQVASLPLCAPTRSGLIACLTCAQHQKALQLLDTQYGGTP
jgi:hypothetical protein